jgi:hypothetical protein
MKILSSTRSSARSSALLIGTALLLSACGGTTSGRHGPVTAGQLPASNAHRGGALPAPGVTTGGGIAGELLGRDAPALTRMFGAPRLDVQEGAAHKLQFSGDRCVLDAYLYAPRAGAAAVVTHVDARALDGSDVDRAACITALQRR